MGVNIYVNIDLGKYKGETIRTNIESKYLNSVYNSNTLFNILDNIKTDVKVLKYAIKSMKIDKDLSTLLSLPTVVDIIVDKYFRDIEDFVKTSIIYELKNNKYRGDKFEFIDVDGFLYFKPKDGVESVDLWRMHMEFEDYESDINYLKTSLKKEIVDYLTTDKDYLYYEDVVNDYIKSNIEKYFTDVDGIVLEYL